MTKQRKIKRAIKFLKGTIGGMMFAFSHRPAGDKEREKNRQELIDSLSEAIKVLERELEGGINQ